MGEKETNFEFTLVTLSRCLDCGWSGNPEELKEVAVWEKDGDCYPEEHCPQCDSTNLKYE